MKGFRHALHLWYPSFSHAHFIVSSETSNPANWPNSFHLSLRPSYDLVAMRIRCRRSRVLSFRGRQIRKEWGRQSCPEDIHPKIVLYGTPKRRSAAQIDRAPPSISPLILALVGVSHSSVSWFLVGLKFMVFIYLHRQLANQARTFASHSVGCSSVALLPPRRQIRPRHSRFFETRDSILAILSLTRVFWKLHCN